MDKQLPNRESIRLKGFDYSKAGAYFVTICSRDKQCVFGMAEDDRIILSRLGRIVEECWTQIPDHFEQATLDEFIIMPNHLHGIILLTAKYPDSRDTIHRVRPPEEHETTESFGHPTSGSLPTIMRTFKAAVTRETRRQKLSDDQSIWQERFFERVIRNDDAMLKAREYIVNNPLKWHLDKENPDR